LSNLEAKINLYFIFSAPSLPFKNRSCVTVAAFVSLNFLFNYLTESSPPPRLNKRSTPLLAALGSAEESMEELNKINEIEIRYFLCGFELLLV